MSEKHEAWMPIYLSDYLRDTQHLSTIEHGAYLLLLFHAWGRDGLLPLDPDRLRRVAGMEPKNWKASWPTLREFFTQGPDGFRHKRIDAELAKARANVDKRSEAGKVGAAKRWNGKGTAIANADANAIAMANECQEVWQNDGPSPPPSPSPTQKEGLEGNISSLPPAAFAFSGRVIRLNRRDFDEWVSAYHAIPDLTAELRALDDWLRDNDDPTLVKRWFQVVSGALAKKHKAELRERRDDDRSAVPIV